MALRKFPQMAVVRSTTEQKGCSSPHEYTSYHALRSEFLFVPPLAGIFSHFSGALIFFATFFYQEKKVVRVHDTAEVPEVAG
jgi:hypothetical protein